MIAHHTTSSDRPVVAAPEDVLSALAVEVTTDGHFAPDVPDHARRRVRAALRHSTVPILRASVRLVRHQDPALAEPVVISALLSVSGRLVRVKTSAVSARIGLDSLQHVLRTAVERLDRHRDRRGHRGHHVRAGEGLDEEHEIHPHGTYAPTSSTVDEAIADLDVLEREFHLFHDVESDEDSLVSRGGPTGYRLARARKGPLVTPPATPVVLDPDDAPTLSVEAAAERLACGGEPYVFFADPATGRGAVLHVERNGDYGLVTLD
ncbi:sigma 54 modulation/S30EA ribosomal C-terminal domain-containing protein [Cryptosporangium japonicum]|uniref:HPF/RaiA family ribosome-associated protein n=1 Tax=Cryptosporangium japonicum TaxID=80872 RepID=A0ABN0TJA5_9ACTN